MTIRICYVARAIAQVLLCRRHGYRYILPAALGFISYTACADNYFNPAFLSGDSSAVADLSQFENSDGQAAGKYRVDV